MTQILHAEDGSPPFDRLPLRSRRRFTLAVPGQTAAPAEANAIPISIVVGGARRPRVVAVAGVHGDEREGPGALAEAWTSVRAENLAGTLVLVPVANASAYREGRRASPLDDLDLNRAFPGRPDGSFTERLAHRIFTDVVGGADFVISLHSWYRDALVVPYVECARSGPAAAASRAAAVALGLEFIEPLDWHPGLLPAAANRAGIPAVETEIGGLAITVPERRALYGRVLGNLLGHLGLLPVMPSAIVPRVVSRTSLVAPAAGMLLAAVDPGAVVRKGSVLGVIRDLHGDEVTRIVAPRDSIVAGVHMAGAIGVDDLAFTLFHPSR
jgi:N-alpha-acetyl-L-2,4-diaminobutyrate deacetylase